jgi:predicted dinucleotide-binding enzyme
MQIGIIGSGRIGVTVARLLTRTDHEIAIANSRGPESMEGLIAEMGGVPTAMTVPDAAEFGEMILVAIPLRAYRSLPPEPFAGKIVIDANNYYPSRDGQIPELDDDSTTSTELLVAHLPGARVVKAFNTMYYETLGAEGKPDAPLGDRLALYIAGDDEGAKSSVSALIEELGFAAVDTGSLAAGGRLQQPGSEIYNEPMTGTEAEQRVAQLIDRRV